MLENKQLELLLETQEEAHSKTLHPGILLKEDGTRGSMLTASVLLVSSLILNFSKLFGSVFYSTEFHKLTIFCSK